MKGMRENEKIQHIITSCERVENYETYYSISSEG
jgi:hypothetical protein